MIPNVLPGTLDLLILKAVSLGEVHGYGVLLRIGRMTDDGLVVQQGALYPALYRLEHQGLIKAEWGVSDNGRKAKYYRLSATGRKRLTEQATSWNEFAAVIARALSATPQEVR
jgi:PadR family transcriptional regulator, regulatory protein PadR